MKSVGETAKDRHPRVAVVLALGKGRGAGGKAVSKRVESLGAGSTLFWPWRSGVERFSAAASRPNPLCPHGLKKTTAPVVAWCL